MSWRLVPGVTLSNHDLWHMPGHTPTGTISAMSSAPSDARLRSFRIGALAGLGAVVAVGVGMLAIDLGGRAPSSPAETVVAWVLYGVYLVVVAADFLLSPSARRPPPWVTILILVVTGIGLNLTALGADFTAVLLVVTAAAAASDLDQSAVNAIVLVQTVAVAVGTAGRGDGFMVVLVTGLYLTFQVFAVSVIRSEKREAESKLKLASANAELLAANALLDVSSRNTERLRIARDLHDVVGHQLTALAIELEVASHKVDGEAIAHVERARTTAKDLLTDIRGVVSELRDTAFGLEATIGPLLDGIPGLDVELDIDEADPVDEATVLGVARILQEVATNAMRHGRATVLRVSVEADKSGLTVSASDDGIGAESIHKGNGLLGIEERAAQLGGEAIFTSSFGEGFKVRVWIPR